MSCESFRQTIEALRSFVHALATFMCLRRPARESFLMSIITGEVQYERGFHLILLDSHLRVSAVLLPSLGLAPPPRCFSSSQFGFNKCPLGPFFAHFIYEMVHKSNGVCHEQSDGALTERSTATLITKRPHQQRLGEGPRSSD